MLLNSSGIDKSPKMTRYNITENIIVGIALSFRLVSVYFYLWSCFRRRNAFRRPATTADAMMIMTREDVGQKNVRTVPRARADDGNVAVVAGRRHNNIMTYRNEKEQLKREATITCRRPIYKNNFTNLVLT